MLTLALDTSQRKISLALIQGQSLVAEYTTLAEDTSAALLSGLDAMLQKQGVSLEQIEHILFGHGPGSFTSLRIGAAALCGLFGARDPQPSLQEVSSLELRALSLENPDPKQICVAFKARQKKVYAGWYDDGVWQDHCLSFQELLQEANRRAWSQKIGPAWTEIFANTHADFHLDDDPIAGKAFLKISNKSKGCLKNFKENIILNYLQPLSDVAIPSS